MINIFFFLFSAYFSKTVRFGSVFRAEMNSACKIIPNKGIFIGFTENSLFSENFRTGYSMAIFMLTAKKLIYTNLAIFGFLLSNKYDSFGFRKFCLKLIEKITKNRKIMITNIFFSIFCIFLKNRRLWLRFQGRNEFCMQKYPIRVFLQDLQKTASFLRIFEQAIAWRFSC